MKKLIFILCILNMVPKFLQASFFEDYQKNRMIQDLEIIRHHLKEAYAPLDWKKEYAHVDLDEAFEVSKNQVLNTSPITTKKFQNIVREFLKTMRDYHVKVTFFSTEASTLPFSIKGAQERYFIHWVDPLRLPPSHYNINIGDEILEFDEKPIATVIKDLIDSGMRESNPQTDASIAEMRFTSCLGLLGDEVNKGPILIKIQSAKTSKVNTYQLHWSYTPEYVQNPLDFLKTLDCIFSLHPVSNKEKMNREMQKIVMATPYHQALAKYQIDGKRGLGSRKSFIPFLGNCIWPEEEQLKDNEETPYWYAYIYQHPLGYPIGYIRIPHYMASFIEVKEFGKIIQIMEEKTQALVIDQVDNFGGSVHFLYQLASMLTNYPLKTPYHCIKISHKEALEAYQTLEWIKLVESNLNLNHANLSLHLDEEKEDQNLYEESDNSLNYQELLFLKDYCVFILEEWNKGKTLTAPTPIVGVDRINPNAKYQYTKPILMLINEMDFSGGDFMPAILQDNQRALLFGTRTAGAGGYVSGFQFPNSNGIDQCSYTASIAERTNLQKIENLGVTPDIEYQITLKDLQTDYKDYVEAVNQAVQILLEKEGQTATPENEEWEELLLEEQNATPENEEWVEDEEEFFTGKASRS